MIVNSGTGGRDPMTPEEYAHAMAILGHKPTPYAVTGDDEAPDEEANEQQEGR
ncbi:hypothetical protein GCM10023191_092420 [Actinoallomurus oryzae]|uniref:Uncharacterized protein n=1 Tax=Actinoallomurus oryzae TaxID=502180 RepID=A0ABP8R557_9ACTN